MNGVRINEAELVAVTKAAAAAVARREVNRLLEPVLEMVQNVRAADQGEPLPMPGLFPEAKR